jgi:NAD(P)H-nitrite reductase large subunit
MAVADGLLVGSPTINGDALPPVLDLIMNMNGVLHGGKVAGAFGSYGWSGEAADMLMHRLNILRMDTVEPAFKVNFKPAGIKLEAARKYGRRFGRRLREKWESFTDKATGKTYWKCTVCGEIFEGALPPAVCPVCGAGQEAFVEYVPELIEFSDDKEIKVVIVGSGAAAISAADALRKRNAKASIDIYSREETLPYYRPVLTKAIAEKVNDTEFLVKPAHYYAQNKISLHLGEMADSIDVQGKRLRLKSGESVPYDKLVLATGASCFIPPIQGASLPEVVALREQSDFDKLNSLVADAPKRIVIIGGGLLGMETADSLSKLGHDVTILEACPCVLPRQIDPEGAPVLEKIIAENSSVTVQRDVFVVEICGHEKVIGVKTKRDKIIDCDIVIISAGIRSNVELAKEAGLKLDRAIVVDEKMRTSNPDIYAAGDCAVFNGRFDGIWETAIEQGKIAGADIAGDDAKYSPKVFGATLHAFGVSLFSVGEIESDKNVDYERISSKDELARIYRKFFFKDGILVGGVLLGDVSKTNSLLSGVTRSVNLEEAKDLKLI